MNGTDEVVRVEIWSDIVCPWCYIGKRRFERALAELDGELEVEVVYRPFQLDPTASPGPSMPVAEAYARKFGGPDQAQAVIDRVTAMAHEAGIEFRMDRALRANTLLAHRLLWLAEPPCPIPQTALKERLLQAYFIDGLDIGDPDVLADCAADVGFDRDEIVQFLDGDAGAAEVRGDAAASARRGHHGRADVRHRSPVGDPGRPGSGRVRPGAPPVRRQSARRA